MAAYITDEHSTFFGLSRDNNNDLPTLLFSAILKDDAKALIEVLDSASQSPTQNDGQAEEGKEIDRSIPDIISTLVAHPLPSNLPPPPDFEPSGSPLHLCCVLDRPVHLALLLVAGGDIEARHGGFRRGVIHESCCSGRGGCLDVLLEVANAGDGDGEENR